MRKIGTTLLGMLAMLAPVAYGQATRTWVSGVGDDANPCSRTAPCKTFAGAISKTAASGEINVLDPGGFGAVTITKSITIDGGGFIAGVLVSGTNGIVISAGASDAVTLRHLDIDGLTTGLNGIRFIAGGTLHIEDSQIFGFTQNGIDVEPNQTGASTVTIKNTTIHENTGSAIFANPNGGGALTIAMNNVEAHNNASGLSADGGMVTARNSDFSQNPTGVSASGNSTLVTLDTGAITYCTTAISSASNAAVRLSNMSIVDNTTGLSTSGGGTITSFVNNRIYGNTTNGAPTSSFYQR